MVKDKLWNFIQIIPPTPQGYIFVSWVVLPVTVDKFECIMETDIKNVGGRHNRSCKNVPYDLDELFKIVSQEMIQEGDWR